MNIFTLFYKYITDALLIIDFTATSDMQFTVEVPHNYQNGDLSTNVAMVIANQMKKRPREIAELLYPHISTFPGVKSVEIAGPGFINIYLTDIFLQNFLKQTYALGSVYGDSKIGENQVINIEFCSANPTGPMHVGHARSAIYGDALANLLKKCGFHVIKEYYINDAGKQIETLAHSLFIRYQQRIGREVELEENCYPGEYLIEIANDLYSQYGDSLNEGDELIRKFALDKIMLMIKQDLKDIGVIHDKFTSEKNDILDKGMVEETLYQLNDLGLLYNGVLDAPKSKAPEDWEAKEQTIFKSSLFGDEIDRAIVRFDGSYTYFAHDAAYHLDKINRGFTSMLLLLGADHGGYTKRIKAVVSALSNNKVPMYVIINQLVNLIKDGKPFKMSKRAGNFLTVQDILSELDKDLLRFAMLSRKNDTVLDLDFNKMKEQSKDNHIFYIQYALSRANSLINRASLIGIKLDLDNADLRRLSLDHDLALIKKIALFPKVIESAARSYEIFRVPYYLYDLATAFHQMWGYGNHNSNFRFILEDDLDLSAARLVLIKTMMNTIVAGLDVIGIEPVFEM